MSLEKMFLHEKTVEIMLKILEAEENGKNIYPLVISKEIGSPYSYISKVLSEFERNALIESEVRGRVRVVRFTEEGRRIAMMLRDLKKELRKDFVARKKLSILKEIVDNAKNNGNAFRVLAPVIAELEELKSSHDSEVVEEVKNLERKIEEVLGGSHE
jgi:predicted transcriptional regulator